MTVPQKGVMYLGGLRPKIFGSALWAAIESVCRVSGSSVVSADAAPDVKTLRKTSLFHAPP